MSGAGGEQNRFWGDAFRAGREKLRTIAELLAHEGRLRTIAELIAHEGRYL